MHNQDDALLRMIEHADRCWAAETANAERLSAKHRLMVTATGALIGLGLFKIEWGASTNEVSRIEPAFMLQAINGLLSIALVLLGWAFIRMRRDDLLPRVKAGLFQRTALGALFFAGMLLIVARERVADWLPLINEPATVIFGIIIIALVTLTFSALGHPAPLDSNRSSHPKAFASHYMYVLDDLGRLHEAQGRREALEAVYYSIQTAVADLRDRNARKWASLRRTQIWFVFGIMFVGLALLLFIWTSQLPQRSEHEHVKPEQPAGRYPDTLPA